MKQEYSFQDLLSIVEKLRGKDGCPWDKEQTHESLKNCMLEEAYEVIDAINEYQQTKENENLCEELGDVLLQVVMHSCIAKEEDRFTIEDVVNGISEKMVRRHPHVFGNIKVENSGQVISNWEEIKQKEKNQTTISEGMKKIPKVMPATIRAEKVQKKAAKIGFDFKNYNEALKKVYEELEELEQARKQQENAKIEEEFGDLLFSIVNLSRFLRINAENSLTNATDKFINRFVDIEIIARGKGRQLTSISIEELNNLWEYVK